MVQDRIQADTKNWEIFSSRKINNLNFLSFLIISVKLLHFDKI